LLDDDDKRYVLSGCFKEGIFGGKPDKTTTAAISIREPNKKNQKEKVKAHYFS
jgi:hypothetical protein